jgi:hypothetical protein
VGAKRSVTYQDEIHVVGHSSDEEARGEQGDDDGELDSDSDLDRDSDEGDELEGVGNENINQNNANRNNANQNNATQNINGNQIIANSEERSPIRGSGIEVKVPRHSDDSDDSSTDPHIPTSTDDFLSVSDNDAEKLKQRKLKAKKKEIQSKINARQRRLQTSVSAGPASPIEGAAGSPANIRRTQSSPEDSPESVVG